MSDVLAKIRKLVELAASSNENEARNAALLACRLIREKKVQLSLEDEKKKEERPEIHSVPFDDLMNAIFNMQKGRGVPRGPSVRSTAQHVGDSIADAVMRGRARATQRTLDDELADLLSDPEETVFEKSQRHRKPSPSPSRHRIHPSGAVLLTAKHTGSCCDCGSSFEIGDRVWFKPRGVVHESCNPLSIPSP